MQCAYHDACDSHQKDNRLLPLYADGERLLPLYVDGETALGLDRVVCMECAIRTMTRLHLIPALEYCEDDESGQSWVPDWQPHWLIEMPIERVAQNHTSKEVGRVLSRTMTIRMLYRTVWALSESRSFYCPRGYAIRHTELEGGGPCTHFATLGRMVTDVAKILGIVDPRSYHWTTPAFPDPEYYTTGEGAERRNRREVSILCTLRQTHLVFEAAPIRSLVTGYLNRLFLLDRFFGSEAFPTPRPPAIPLPESLSSLPDVYGVKEQELEIESLLRRHPQRPSAIELARLVMDEAGAMSIRSTNRIVRDSGLPVDATEYKATAERMHRNWEWHQTVIQPLLKKRKLDSSGTVAVAD